MTYVVLDSRDLDKRLDELEEMKEAYLESVGSSMEEADLTDEESEELEELQTLRDEVSEWIHGAQLILDDSFEEYAQYLAEEIMGFDAWDQWPYRCIDWESAADELKQDYSEVTYQGKTYLVRD